MDNNIRDLSAWYPFIPGEGTLPDIAANILDLSVSVTLPSYDIQQRSDGNNNNMLSCALTAIDNEAATISIDCLESFTVDVPVFIGRDAMPDDVGDYVIIKEEISESLSNLEGLYIRPDCLTLGQLPPTATFYTRGQVTQDDVASSSTIVPMSSGLAFRSGHNVSVAVENGAIVFTGAPNAGSRVFTTPPYTDLPKYVQVPGKGLRSINGVNSAGNVPVQFGPALKGADVRVDGRTIILNLATTPPVSSGGSGDDTGT